MNGINILRANVVATVIFSISAIVAAVVFDGVAKTQGVVVALSLFTIGIATFLWGYWTAVQKSRELEISVAEMYFLMGRAIPKKVKVNNETQIPIWRWYFRSPFLGVKLSVFLNCLQNSP